MALCYLPLSVRIITGKHCAKNFITKLNDGSDNGTCNPAARNCNQVEYNKCKKEELKHLNEQITKQGNIAEHKPRPDTSTYVYASSLSVLGLAICEYLLYNKFKKQERNLIDVPPPPVPKTGTEPKRDIFEML